MGGNELVKEGGRKLVQLNAFSVYRRERAEGP